VPRGMHPNSLANLKKGKATQFGSGDPRAVKAQAMGTKTQSPRHTIAEEMRQIMNGEGNPASMAAKLVKNMDKSPEWYKLGLRMLGELPPEQVDVRATTVSPEAKEQLDKLMEETRGDIR
jgi:hypothetical protein